MVARPARPRSRSADAFPEFIVWSERPAGTWLSLPHSFTEALPSGLDGLWLQADGCCSKASWVSVAVTATGDAYLTRGWQTFAHARVNVCQPRVKDTPPMVVTLTLTHEALLQQPSACSQRPSSPDGSASRRSTGEKARCRRASPTTRRTLGRHLLSESAAVKAE